MPTIVDGYNLIFGLGWLRQSQGSLALEKSRRRLIHELCRRIDSADRGDVTIVFDAKNRPIKLAEKRMVIAGFEVLFAQGYDEADTLIEEKIRKHSTPQQLQVVSDDRRIKDAARRRKSNAIGCEAWLDSLEKTQAFRSSDQQSSGGKRAVTGELDDVDWIAEFELDESELAELDAGLASENDVFPPGFGKELEG